jgi:molecular chaperone GrpE
MSKSKKSPNNNNNNASSGNNNPKVQPNLHPTSMPNHSNIQNNSNSNLDPNVQKSPDLVEGLEIKLKLVDELNQKIKELTASSESKDKEILDLKENLEITTSKMTRIAADSENLKKHQELENQQVRKALKKSIARNLLEFLNNQFLTLNFLKEVEDDKTKSSLNTLKVSFDTIVRDLAKQSIEFIIPEVGGQFDPELMQAISRTTEDGKVLTIVTLGLKVDGQVIQPSSVII